MHMNDQKKIERYQRITKQLCDLTSNSPSLHAKMATINAILYHKFPYMFWVGFYFLSQNRLIVGPYQGPLACQELKQFQGVCWKAVLERKTIIVPDVEQFPGHIACDSRSKSEIVVPVFNKDELIAVLDIDSDSYNSFSFADKQSLEAIVAL
jgi:L-methionine (R)-S-oxide reductase